MLTSVIRFQMNNTSPPHIQFVKKPVYSVMGLLSLLGEYALEIESKFNDPLVSALATRSEKIPESVTVAVVYANNTDENRNRRCLIELDLKLQHLEGFDARYVIYVLDNIITNPYSMWKNAGSPVYPDAKLRQEMRNVQVGFCILIVVYFYSTLGESSLRDMNWNRKLSVQS